MTNNRLSVLRSTSMRLALGYAALFIVSALVLVGLLWWRTAAYLDREIDAVIVADTQDIGERMRDFGLEDAIQTVRDRARSDIDRNAIFLMTDSRLNPLAGNLTAWPAEVARTPGWYEADMFYAGQLRATRLFNFGLPGNFHLLVGRDLGDRAAVKDLILRGLAWSIAAALGIATLGGILARRALLTRVDAINRTATAIVQGDLARRVPVRNSADEFDQLAQTINRMLEQIQQSIEGVRNVSNAVAHDLRTPLAEVRARLEDLLRSRPAPDVTFTEIEGTVDEIDRLIGTSNALLRLAEIDSGLRRSGFRHVDLAAVILEAIDLYRPAAEAKDIVLTSEISDGHDVNGDPFLLAQAIANLLDNAVKYAPPHGKISVRLAGRGDKTVEVAVADDGPGIPEAEKGRVVERFYRGDSSRGKAGVGLGLSLVASVAKLHAGIFELSDNHPGLIAALILPVSADTESKV